MTDPALRELAENARAWPFEEARKVVKRLAGKTPDKGYVLFETGYGPSGLPHIGTFGEVARTTWVRRAFEMLSDVPTRLFAFSDDMDGMRRVPSNVPNQDMLQAHLGKPLTAVPDPFGTHESFGHHNNARLRQFLDDFGFDYDFVSSTEYYNEGRFDSALRETLVRYDAILGAVLPTLGEERRQTYSPFLPICPRTGVVLQVPILAQDVAAGTIVYADPDSGAKVEVPVIGGHCKLQWKCDWAMRWYALDVDYEMSGKDLIDSVTLSSKIERILGARPPEGFNYELFLDEKGERISKSKGNGLAVEEWLTYGAPESLALFMYQNPRRAKRLYFDVIPKSTDDYLAFLGKFAEEAPDNQLENPIWHLHRGPPPREAQTLNFSILLNLASVCHAEDKSVIWGYIKAYAPEASAESHPVLDGLVGYAVTYYKDFVRPNKTYRLAETAECAALQDLRDKLAALPVDSDPADLQTAVFDVGKAHNFENLRDWFRALYEILLGQSKGPRMGSFIALYGVAKTVALIDRALDGEDLAA